jgi:MuDR family transposase
MSYADEPYFRKPPRIDQQFGVGQRFSAKSELKVKIVDFHVQRNIELEVKNSSKSKLVTKCKDSNCPWRMYVTPNIIDIWEIRTNPLEHSCFGGATRADHLLLFVHSEGWITLSTLVHIISFSTTLTHCMVIGVVMTINKIDICTTVQSLGQIQQKSIKKEEGRYAFQWLWMKWMIVSTGCQLEVELVPTEHDLDYQCIYVFCCYIYQNNWITIFVVIFLFV